VGGFEGMEAGQPGEMKMRNKNKIIYMIITMLAFGFLHAADMVGVISDDVIKPPDLHTFYPPVGAGSDYIDPAFGTRVVRVTDNSHFGEFVLGGYLGNSEICYFNKDGSYFIAEENETESGSRAIGTFLYNGNTGERIRMIALSNTYIRPYWVRWPLADRYKKDGKYVTFDPNTHLYKYHDNELRLVNINDIDNYVVLRKFTEYSELGPAGGEGDLSADGRFWVMDGDGKEMFVYDLIDDIKYPVSTFDLGSLGSKGGNVGVDYATITPSGKYIAVSWGTDPGIDRRLAGIELYDLNWNFIRQLHPSIIHWAMGYDAFGDEVIYTVVTHDYPQFFSSCGAKAGDLVSVRMSDGRQILLKDVPIWAHLEISSSNYASTGDYIYVGYHRRSEDVDELWSPFWDEIIEVPTDGSQEVRRFLHHYSHYVSGKSMKYYQPDPMVNRQGTKLIYRSTYNNDIGDLYMFDVGTRGTDQSDNMPPNPPINLRQGETNYGSIELLWDEPGAASDGDRPLHYSVFREGQFVANVYDTRYRDTGLEESQSYRYTITGVDASGNESVGYASATFPTAGDKIAPALVYLKVNNTTSLRLEFSEALDTPSAQTASNYRVDNGVNVLTAVLIEADIVLLTTSEMALGTTYTLTVNNIADASSQKNMIVKDTQRTFALLSGFYDDFEDGADPSWVFRTPERWSIDAAGDNNFLFLNTSDYGDYTKKMLGEYAILQGSEQWGQKFRFTCDAISNEDLLSNENADYAVAFGFVDDLNYYYVQFHPGDIKLHRIVNGERTLFEQFPTQLALDEEKSIAVELNIKTLIVAVDGEEALSYELPETVSGKIALGSFNDSAWFDNVNLGPLDQQDTTPPAPPSGLLIVNEN
jgi:hypothetical protein